MTSGSESEEVRDYDDAPQLHRRRGSKRRRSPSPEYEPSGDSGVDIAVEADRLAEHEVYASTELVGEARFGAHPVSLMDRETLTGFAQMYDFPSDAITLVPRAECSPEIVPSGFLCLYPIYFAECGLRFPIPFELLSYLSKLGLCFPQACPSVIRTAICSLVRAAETGQPLRGPDIARFFSVKKNSKGKGTFYASARGDLAFLKDLPAKDHHMRLDSYFYVKICPSTIGMFPPSEIRSIWAKDIGRVSAICFNSLVLVLLILILLLIFQLNSPSRRRSKCTISSQYFGRAKSLGNLFQ